MEHLNNTSKIFFDGLFYFFGFMNNPAEKHAKEILQENPGQKIRNDVSKVNKDLKDSFTELRKKALCLDE